jgi:hypothetical protein
LLSLNNLIYLIEKRYPFFLFIFIFYNNII